MILLTLRATFLKYSFLTSLWVNNDALFYPVRSIVSIYGFHIQDKSNVSGRIVTGTTD